eukprot:5642586-Pyramimonas_sp.AAC.1
MADYSPSWANPLAKANAGPRPRAGPILSDDLPRRCEAVVRAGAFQPGGRHSGLGERRARPRRCRDGRSQAASSSDGP